MLFLFTLIIFCFTKNGIAHFVAGCLHFVSALRRFAPRRVPSRVPLFEICVSSTLRKYRFPLPLTTEAAVIPQRHVCRLPSLRVARFGTSSLCSSSSPVPGTTFRYAIPAAGTGTEVSGFITQAYLYLYPQRSFRKRHHQNIRQKQVHRNAVNRHHRI